MTTDPDAWKGEALIRNRRYENADKLGHMLGKAAAAIKRGSGTHKPACPCARCAAGRKAAASAAAKKARDRNRKR